MQPIKPTVRRRSRPAASSTSPLTLVSDGTVDRRKLCVEYLPISQLREPARRLRRYSKRHLHALKASLEEFGFVRPILVDRDGTVISGVALWLAAKELKHDTIPVIRDEHLTPEQVRLYRIADNKLQMGVFDEGELRLEFLELSDLSVELDLDVEVTGFTTKEIDDITLHRPPDSSDGSGDADGDEDEDLEPGPGAPISRTGDVWIIDSMHKVICGNALRQAAHRTPVQERPAAPTPQAERDARLSAARVERLLLDRLASLLPTGSVSHDLFGMIERVDCRGEELRIAMGMAALAADNRCDDMLAGRAQQIDPQASIVGNQLQLSIDARPTRRGKTVRAKVHLLDDVEQRQVLADLVRVPARSMQVRAQSRSVFLHRRTRYLFLRLG